MNVATTLYPHQKKALTFLLDREKDKGSGGSGSLWQVRKDASGRPRAWYNPVTGKEYQKEPPMEKGGILADDVRKLFAVQCSAVTSKLTYPPLRLMLFLFRSRQCHPQMGLGKTISIVSLMDNTMDASRVFAFGPMKKITLRVAKTQAEAPPLTAANFAAQVWGMPDNAGDIDASAEMDGLSSGSGLGSGAGGSGKNGKKGKRETQKEQLDAARMARIKAKSRATLIICPLSTIANWEDQFKEHWSGEVTVVGGTSGSAVPPPGSNLVAAANKQADLARDRKSGGGKTLKLYVYHGASRRPDVNFLADFDAVITTYSTLATEYSKQVKSSALYEDDGSAEVDARAAADDSGSESFSDDGGNSTVIKLKEKKPKKRPPGAALAAGLEVSSALQQIHWFRVVLDEAQ